MSQKKKKKEGDLTRKEENLIKNPHDLLVKATLSDPLAMQEFAKAHFPADTLKRIDSNSLHLTNKSYVADELKEFHTDLVFAFTIENQPGYAYCILEHQSSPDALMPLRFIKYTVALLEDHLKNEDNKNKPWPTILTICLYHHPDEKPYPYSTSVYDCFVDPHMAEKLGIFTKFKLSDLNITSDKTLGSHGSIGLMERLLKYSRHRDAYNQLEQLLEENKERIILRGDYWKVLLIYSVQVIGKVLGKRDISEKEIVTLFKEKLSVNDQEAMITIGQTIEKRGEKRGMQKGMQKEKKAIAKSMLKKGTDINFIQEVTGLSKETIRELKTE
jgi:predicted transposase/invertase (TIGR01784 family)